MVRNEPVTGVALPHVARDRNVWDHARTRMSMDDCCAPCDMLSMRTLTSTVCTPRAGLARRASTPVTQRACLAAAKAYVGEQCEYE